MKQCPAFDKICIKCNKKNHFAKMCTSQNNSIRVVEQEEIDEIDQLFMGTPNVYYLKNNNSSSNIWRKKIKINNEFFVISARKYVLSGLIYVPKGRLLRIFSNFFFLSCLRLKAKIFARKKSSIGRGRESNPGLRASSRSLRPLGYDHYNCTIANFTLEQKNKY